MIYYFREEQLIRNKRRTDQEWLSLIQECRSSGFSDRNWCEQNNISINTFYNTVTRLRKKACMIPEATGSTMDDSPEIVPLSLVRESHAHVLDSPRQLPTDVTSSGEALTIMVNGCKVAVSNNACREVIYHTISALREL